MLDNRTIVLNIFLVAVGLITLAVQLFQRRKRSSNPEKASAVKGMRTYLRLRNQLFHLKREQIGLAVTAKPTEPWGVVMDWGLTPNTCTVVAICDGTASIYLSSGGGSIGGGNLHNSIREAAKRAVCVAAQFQPQMHATETYPLARGGELIFYLLTDAGVFTGGGSEDEFSAHRHPWSKLGDAMQEIITQYRFVQTAKGPLWPSKKDDGK